MSTPFKPLSEQITGKMIADLKAGTSIFQQPNNSLNSALPFNIESGRRYAGPSALILLMQKRDDPRWGTSNQANRNRTAVNKGTTGTLIQFMSSYEFQKMVDNEGKPVLKENGKQRTERVRLDEPKQVDAWLFNGEQMRKLEKWAKEPNVLSPAERAQAILDNSKVVIEQGGDDMFYDRQLDAIVIPETEQFDSPEQYYAGALHLLAHRVISQEAFDRPQVGNNPGNMIREELRTNLASLFLSKELNLPYDLNEHVGYVESWSAILKDDPSELFNAASDAQEIVDHIMGFEQQIGEKRETGQSVEDGQEHKGGLIAGSGVDTPKIDPTKLNEGEIISHNGTEFKVIKAQKNNVYQMQDLGSERKFKMSAKDELFGFLLDARNNSQELTASRGVSATETAYQESEGVDKFENEQYEIER
ncbi:zincin-like metallopeptidase domain-containing protein [Mucilaginibacter endophyticus]|uniref:zincin-like metallopeptidase domain-containing protein n=1 Tax=Mucilaginibacter endophyticus TaxID=2675003 RepID=UPI000E0CEC00|nr:zincin-like metallopeptidase domain-containing protein [Mucilaginibacter endophyticus]